VSDHGERRADTRTVDSGGTRGLLLGLVALVALTFSWPNGTTTQTASAVGMITALGLASAAVVMAVRALMRTQGPDAVAPGAVSAIITGTMTCLMALLLLAVLALMWAEFGALERCQTRAITETAQSRCADAFQDDVRARFKLGAG
jgi:hypothetical protein